MQVAAKSVNRIHSAQISVVGCHFLLCNEIVRIPPNCLLPNMGNNNKNIIVEVM